MRVYKENETSINLMKLNTIRQNEHKKEADKWERIRFLKTILKIFQTIMELKKIGVRRTVFNISCLLWPKKYIDFQYEHNYQNNYELNYRPVSPEIKRKIAVYTAIFGKYDNVKEPYFISGLCDYYIITDLSVAGKGAWKKIDPGDIEILSSLDDYHKARYCKMFPHILFPDYDYSVWVDGNIQIVADLYPLVDRLDRSSIGIFNHPYRNCIYTEANRIKYNNYADWAVLDKQMKEYRKEGFPRHFGMCETSIVVRRHHKEECIFMMEQWWTEINTYTMRDQLSLPYILWKQNQTIDYVQELGHTLRNNPRVLTMKHVGFITFRTNKSKKKRAKNDKYRNNYLELPGI